MRITPDPVPTNYVHAFANHLPFLLIKLQNIKFNRSEFVSNKIETTLVASIKIKVNLYFNHNFSVTTQLMDIEFDDQRSGIESMGYPTLNTASTKEQAPEIERIFRVVKEWIRALISFDQCSCSHLTY